MQTENTTYTRKKTEVSRKPIRTPDQENTLASIVSNENSSQEADTSPVDEPHSKLSSASRKTGDNLKQNIKRITIIVDASFHKKLKLDCVKREVDMSNEIRKLAEEKFSHLMK